MHWCNLEAAVQSWRAKQPMWMPSRNVAKREKEIVTNRVILQFLPKRLDFRETETIVDPPFLTARAQPVFCVLYLARFKYG